MTMPTRLTADLDQVRAAYTPIRHIPARSSQYAASLLHIPGKQIAKTVAPRTRKADFARCAPGFLPRESSETSRASWWRSQTN